MSLRQCKGHETPYRENKEKEGEDAKECQYALDVGRIRLP
jgi:hypothetical protein